MAMDVRTKVGYLKTVDIFMDLADDELAALESSITTIPCAAAVSYTHLTLPTTPYV